MPSIITLILKNILITVLAILVGLVLFEFFSGFIFEKSISNDHERSKRYMLFSASNGAVPFLNQGKIFTYSPNLTIHATAYYENGAGLHKEYDYEFKTNNLGLVQKLDVNKKSQSTLLLGDSFTEGQGAVPWFYELEKNNSQDIQLINGGLLGTGFAQWKVLHDQLTDSGVRINKVVIPFISDDYQRTIWNFPDRVLNCLAHIEKCKGDEGYYPRPLKDEDTFVGKLKEFRDAEHSDKQAIKQQRFFRKYFSNLHFIWGYLKKDYKLKYANPNADAMEALINQYGKNVVFIHLPTKEELDNGAAVNHMGKLAREKISSSGGKIVDGFQVCGLKPADYFLYDPHPNSEGYKKISNCVSKIVFGTQ